MERPRFSNVIFQSLLAVCLEALHVKSVKGFNDWVIRIRESNWYNFSVFTPACTLKACILIGVIIFFFKGN